MVEEQKPTDKEKAEEAVHYHYHEHREHHRGGAARFVLGLLVILIGLLYLARTMGWTGISLGINLLRLWPLFIILAGLALMPKRGGFLSGALKFLVGVAVIIIVFLAILTDSARRYDDMHTQNRLVGVAKEPGITKASLGIKAGSGKIALSAGTDLLVSGEFQSHGTDLEVSSKRYGERQEIRLRGDGLWRHFGMRPNVLNLKVNKEIPLAIEIDAGASSVDLDLSDVFLEELDIDTGASRLNLVLGDRSPHADVNINAGASNVEIVLPQGAGVRMRLDSGASAKHIEGLRESGPGEYASENYEDAYSKIDLYIVVGISNLEVGWR